VAGAFSAQLLSGLWWEAGGTCARLLAARSTRVDGALPLLEDRAAASLLLRQPFDFHFWIGQNN